MGSQELDTTERLSTYTHTHAHTRPHIHTCAHMCTHARAHMCTCMHTCVRAHMHTHTRGYLLAALCGFLVVPFSSLVAEHTHVYTCTHIHTCAHMHIHTQMRACTHSHTLTGTHTHMGATFELPYVGFSLCPSRLLWQSTGSGYAVFSSCSPQPQ